MRQLRHEGRSGRSGLFASSGTSICSHIEHDEGYVGNWQLVPSDVASGQTRVNGSLFAAETTFGGRRSANRANLLAGLFRKLRVASTTARAEFPLGGSCGGVDSRRDHASLRSVPLKSGMPGFTIVTSRSFAPTSRRQRFALVTFRGKRGKA